MSAHSYGQTENISRDTLCSELVDSVVVDSLQAMKNGKRIDDMISYAKKFLGTPYKYAGMSPSGFDCSGFIGYVMGGFGFSIPRTSYSIAEVGKTIKLSEVQKGDLLFFKGSNINSTKVGHVAMVVEVNQGEIKMIHSSNSNGVAIEKFSGNRYYVPRFIRAKRMNLPSQ